MDAGEPTDDVVESTDEVTVHAAGLNGLDAHDTLCGC